MGVRAVPEAAVPDLPEQSVRERGRWALGTPLCWAVVVLVVVAGIAARAWFMFHIGINADEAVVGEMVVASQHGHFTTFYWGQAYGGVEPLVVLALSYVFGKTWFVLVLTPALLAAAAAALVGLIVRRLTGDRWLAALAGALAWVWPEVDLISSTHEWAFRGTTMVFGLVCCWLALRIDQGSRSVVDFAALGLAVGLGWWSSPEVVFPLVAAALIMLRVVVREWRGRRAGTAGTGRLPSFVGRLGIAVAAALVGMLPWIYTNVGSHFASLSQQGVNSAGSGYGTRLATFFKRDLPMQLGVTRVAGDWLGGSSLRYLAAGVAVAVVGVAALFCLLRRDAAVAFVAGMVVFPFVFALNPETWYWHDGRFATELGPLLAVVVAVGVHEAVVRGQRRVRGDSAGHALRRAPGPAARGVLAAITVLATAATLSELNRASDDTLLSASGFTSKWGPEQQVDRTIAALERHRVEAAYGEYWVAFVLDYLSGNHLEVAAVGPDRWPQELNAVEQARDPAFLFYAPDAYALGGAQFDYPGSAGGVDGLSLARFEQVLASLHVGYTVVPAGHLDAVVPARTVTLAELHIPPSVFYTATMKRDVVAQK